jgi:hypothetical protein
VRMPYQVNDRQFEGMIVYDDTAQRKRPVVFMQPDWKGVCADTVAQAHVVARADNAVLMVDMFGAGYVIRPSRESNLRQSEGLGGISSPVTAARSSSSAASLLCSAHLQRYLPAQMDGPLAIFRLQRFGRHCLGHRFRIGRLFARREHTSHRRALGLADARAGGSRCGPGLALLQTPRREAVGRGRISQCELQPTLIA